MAKRKVTQEVLSASIDVEFVVGQPPDEALSLAIQSLFIGLAKRIKARGVAHFPLHFPMKMTMESEQVHWNFTVILKLESGADFLEKNKSQNET